MMAIGVLRVCFLLALRIFSASQRRKNNGSQRKKRLYFGLCAKLVKLLMPLVFGA